MSFKFFTGYVGEQAAAFGIDPQGITPDFFFEACESLRRAGAPAFAAIHAEDPYVRGILVDRLRQISGRTDHPLVAWADASPEWAESMQIYTYGLVAQQVGVPLYPVHVSAAHTVETLNRMRAGGANIIGETIALFLSTTAEEMDAAGMGAKAKIQPPLRHEADKERLWLGIKEGALSVIGTDSLTYSAKYKQEQEEVNAYSKKMEELQKKSVLLDMTNPAADMARINADTATITKNKNWLKNLSKDIYISETVNILSDLHKSGMHMNMGTGMK